MDIGMIKRIGSRKALIIVAFANWLVNPSETRKTSAKGGNIICLSLTVTVGAGLIRTKQEQAST
jgi:hypothetical protein